MKCDLLSAEHKADFLCDDICVAAAPLFGGIVALTAAERLKKLHGNVARVIAVCVYVNKAYEDTLSEICDILEECAFRVIAAIDALSEHSIVRRFAGADLTQRTKRLFHIFREDM